MKLFKKLRARFIKPKEQDLNDEMRFHLEKEIEANVAGGMNAEEARRRALIDFGGVQQAREAVHRVSARNVLESSLQDIRFGVRMLRKSPSFTAIAVGILALGIGANTAIFSAVNAVLFARWSIRNQQQLVAVSEPTGADKGVTLVSVPNFEDYRRQQTTFEQLSLWLGQSINLTGQERPDRLIGAFVSDNYFEMLGVHPARGRLFHASDEHGPNSAPYIVLSYDFWHSQFDSDVSIIGSVVAIDKNPFTVIGVATRKGQSASGQDYDDAAFIPYTTFARKIQGGLGIFEVEGKGLLKKIGRFVEFSLPMLNEPQLVEDICVTLGIGLQDLEIQALCLVMVPFIIEAAGLVVHGLKIGFHAVFLQTFRTTLL